ncbi:O-methyltransferase [Pseudovibrio sp. Alg231-02]|uniref:O-methyltransferase n=1 Tax=Pseudovibrio sp. Alg231-02 TaxID=1922223 RepID=UPI000D551E14
MNDPFHHIQTATRLHLAEHGCGAYTFEDGPSLTTLSRSLRPDRVLELGTALGYTACCLAHGCSSAQVDTIDKDPLHLRLAARHLENAGLMDRVKLHLGSFDTVIDNLSPFYDMAFFDGFAPSPQTIERVRELLTPTGVLVCANLGLADLQSARKLTLDFNDPARWKSLPNIEAGQTLVLRKVTP